MHEYSYTAQLDILELRPILLHDLDSLTVASMKAPYLMKIL